MPCWACGFSTACWGLKLEHAPRSRLLCFAEVKLKTVLESSFRNIVLKLIWSFLDRCQTVVIRSQKASLKYYFPYILCLTMQSIFCYHCIVLVSSRHIAACKWTWTPWKVKLTWWPTQFMLHMRRCTSTRQMHCSHSHQYLYLFSIASYWQKRLVRLEFAGELRWRFNPRPDGGGGGGGKGPPGGFSSISQIRLGIALWNFQHQFYTSSEKKFSEVIQGQKL